MSSIDDYLHVHDPREFPDTSEDKYGDMYEEGRGKPLTKEERIWMLSVDGFSDDSWAFLRSSSYLHYMQDILFRRISLITEYFLKFHVVHIDFDHIY